MRIGNYNRGTPLSALGRTVAGAPVWQVKKPEAVDIYEGEYPVDITAGKPFAVIAKASGRYSDGYIREDKKVDWYINLARQNGAKTGIYHFLRPGKISEQADVFLGVWDRLGGCDIRPVIDVEVDPSQAGYSTAQWKTHILEFVDRVQNRTGKDPIIYTSLYFWSLAGNLQTGLDCWVAWYPYFPDNYSTLPSKYVPSGFARWAMWQYADDGRSQGYFINDYNMFSDWFLKELGSPPPDNKEWQEYFNNNRIEVSHGREERYRWPFEYHVAKVRLTEIDKVWTTPGPITSKALTENFLDQYDLDLAVNMDEVVTNTLVPKGWGVSNGKIYKDSTSETGVQFDAGNNILGMQWPRHPKAYNIACGSNILVQDGAVYPGLDNVEADPRTILGYDDQYIYFIMVDGRLVAGEPGVTRADIADWLVNRGIPNAHNLDGGGSSRGAVKASNTEIRLFNRPCENRNVINHIGLKLKGDNSMPTARYSCEVLKSTRVRKSLPGTNTPSIWGEVVDTLAPGHKFESNELVEKLAVGGSKPEASGTWVLVDPVNQHWTAAVYNGERFVAVTDNGPVDPSDPVVKTHQIDVYSDGSLVIDGKPYT